MGRSPGRSKTSPAQRSLKWARDQGYHCQKVEYWQATPYSKLPGRRIDLFGGIDILAMRSGLPLWGIQTCGYTSHAPHRKKLLSLPSMRLWLETGSRLTLVSWKGVIPDGKKLAKWTPRIEEITLDMFETMEILNEKRD